MGTTPFGLPFPEATDEPYVHLDLKALAEKVDALLKAAAGIARGKVNSGANVPPGTWVDVSVNFPANTFPEPPVLTALCASSRFTVGVLAISANSATLRIANWSPAAASPGDVHWIAVPAS